MVARAGAETLIERAIDQTGYDLAVLAMPGGQRRLANVRKLMRLAREHEAAHGPDLRGFLDLVTRRARSGGAAGGGIGAHPPRESRESEAPVEGEALDAVRLMTIHRAKGLEFEVVCVADLGRGPRWRAEVLRVGRDGRFGLRLAEPGTGRRESALDYKALGDERIAAEAREERRLFYVAMTRARERLILSGAAKLDAWPALENGGGGGPVAWIGPAVEQLEGVEVTFVRPEDVPPPVVLPAPVGGACRAGGTAPVSEAGRAGGTAPVSGAWRAGGNGAAADEPTAAGPVQSPGEPAPAPGIPAAGAPPVSALSYSSLAAYRRCGYRFYAERVLRLPALPGDGGAGGASAGAGLADRPGGLSALDRGTLVHALLERLDFRRPRRPTEAMIAQAAERSGLPAVSAASRAPRRAMPAALAHNTRAPSAAQSQAGNEFVTCADRRGSRRPRSAQGCRPFRLRRTRPRSPSSSSGSPTASCAGGSGAPPRSGARRAFSSYWMPAHPC